MTTPRALAKALAVLLLASTAAAFTTVHPSDPTWPGGTINYQLNASSFTSNGLPGAPAALTASFVAWQNDTLSTVLATRGSDTGRLAVDDGFNDVYYVASGWAEGSGVLAVTYFQFNASGMTEADILVNGDEYTWTTNPGGGCTDDYDLQATVAHEAGHALGLGHSSESDSTCDTGSGSYDQVLCDATMYYSGGTCDTTTRSLECDDRAGIRFLYPAGGTPRADWSVSGFAAAPAGGDIAVGAPVAITGKALNVGSVTTTAGLSGLWVSDSASFPGGSPATTQPLAADAPCRTRDVSFNRAFTAGEGGTRWLVVKLDSGNTTTEFDETDASNVAVFGPYNVLSGPVLHADQASLTFNATLGGANPASQSIAITNTGGGTFTWSATDDRTWLSESPTSGSPGGSFSVSVDTTGLSAGVHSGTVTVTAPGASGSPLQVPITLNLVAGAILTTSPPSFTFVAAPGGALPASQPLSISNTGTGSMSWSVSDDVSWLSLAPGSGTNTGTVTLSVTTTAMPAGSYPATVTVTAVGAQGSPAAIDVTLDLSSLVLSVTPPSLSYSGPVGGAAPPAQSLSLTNSASSSVLAFTATSNKPWLAVAPGSGNTPGSVSVSVSPAGLPAGTHSGAITVTATGALGSPVDIPVTYQLSNTPSIATSSPSLTFAAVQGTSPAPQSLTIRNDGAGTLSYTVTDNAPWLTLAPGSGALGAGSTRAHSVTVDGTGLPVGQQVATITITDPAADDSPKTVAVTFDVTASPPLSVSPPTLTFAATALQPTPPSQSITVDTGGDASAPWSATSSQPWLTLAPASGSGNGSIAATAAAVGLAAGSYPATITVTAPTLTGSPRTVGVTLAVATGPRLSASPGTAQWSVARLGPLPTATSVSVTNVGTGALSWTTSGAPSWLSVTPPSGTAPATVALQPTRTDLAPGRYTGTLTITASGSYDSPRFVDLTYDVIGPSITLSPATITFDVVDGVAVSPSSVNVALSAGGAWTARSSKPWLSVSPPSGNGDATLAVSLLQASTLPIGILDGAVVVASSGAANSPAPLPIVVRSRPAPALSIFPSSLELDARVGGGVQSVGSLAIDEAGDGAGAWSVTSKPSWLSLSASSGAHGATLAISVDPGAMGAGTQAGTISFDAQGVALDVPVTLKLHSLPSLRAQPAQVELIARTGFVSGTESVAVANVGTPPATFTILVSDPWLRATGSLVAPSTLSVSADASALPVGQRTGTLTLSSATSTTAVPVHLVVVAANAPVADFSATPSSGCASLQVTLDNLSLGATTHAWTFEGAGTSSLAEPGLTFAAPGRHELTLEETSAGGHSRRTRTVVVRQTPLASAGPDRVVAFAADATIRVALDGARVAAAAPARVATLQWTTSRGTFEDSGVTTSSLERPVLRLPSARGGTNATLVLAVTDDAGCSATDQVVLTILPESDADTDGTLDLLDNCPGVANASQADSDADGRGDRCDDCPLAADPLQVDVDADGIGDACDPSLVATVALDATRSRACEGTSNVEALITAPARVRQARIDVGGRAPASARALETAAGAGGTAWISAASPQRVELRVPAGMPSGAGLGIDVPVQPADVVVAVPCAGATLDLALAELDDVPCSDGSIDLQADGDVAPAGGGSGGVDIADVVRLLRASVGLDVLDASELARGDLSPGSVVAGTWRASPDCRVDVADVVVALRATVGLILLP